MRPQFKIMFVLILAVIFSLCAGFQGKKSPALAQQLPDMVSVSFHEESKVRIEVQVIKAGRQSNYIDPSLGRITQSLQESLSFSSFTLVGGKILHLKIGEKGIMPIYNRYFLRVIPRSLTPEIARIEIGILKGHREVFHTFVETVDRGVATIGGPQVGHEVLLLRITTFILRTSGCWQRPCATDNTDKMTI